MSSLISALALLSLDLNISRESSAHLPENSECPGRGL